MRTSLVRAAGLSVVLLCPAHLLAQPDKPSKPSSDRAPEHAPPPKAADNTRYPEAVKKELYASNDLRGKPAPKFEVQKWLSTEPQRGGKTVLIDFWATWCGPCVALVPELIDFQSKFKDDLVVIGVSDESEQTVRAFMKEKKVSYPMAIDPGKKMNKAIGVKGIPHVLVISSDGVVRWQGFPLSDEDPLTEETLKRIIDIDKGARAKDKAPDKTPKPSDTPGEKPSGKK